MFRKKVDVGEFFKNIWFSKTKPLGYIDSIFHPFGITFRIPHVPISLTFFVTDFEFTKGLVLSKNLKITILNLTLFVHTW
jgi:hypothetical protein